MLMSLADLKRNHGSPPLRFACLGVLMDKIVVNAKTKGEANPLAELDNLSDDECLEVPINKKPVPMVEISSTDDEPELPSLKVGSDVDFDALENALFKKQAATTEPQGLGDLLKKVDAGPAPTAKEEWP
eukprot:1911958-Pyramimonas_sp.AAC.1